MRLRKFLGHKVGKGKFALPLWTVGLAAMAIAAVAGQAVGPVLSGSVSGSVGVVVEQTLRLDVDSSSIIEDDDDDADDFAATVNDEGTGFTVAVETDIGQIQTVNFELMNDSDQDVNGILPAQRARRA